MFCKNCGKELEAKVAVCTQCGFAKGTGGSFCPNCNNPVSQEAIICTVCGTSLKNQHKSKIVAGLLGIFLGAFGAHNFYLGYKSRAITQLLITLLTCGIGAAVTSIWGLIEGIMILAGNINTDADGVPLTD